MARDAEILQLIANVLIRYLHTIRDGSVLNTPAIYRPTQDPYTEDSS